MARPLPSGVEGEVALGRRRAGLHWFWLLAFCPAGCSGGPAVIPAQPSEAYQFQETRGGVRVGVDPYFTVERIRPIFRGGEEFPASGLLPVQVSVENGSGEEIRARPQDFRLLRQEARGEAPLSAYDAFSLTKVTLGLWGALPVIGGSLTAARNEPRLRDLESREMRERVIAPGDSTTGFVYFRIAPGERDLAGSRVMVVVRTAAGRDVTYEIPVEGRRDIPVPPAAPATAAPPVPPGPAPSGPAKTEGAGGGVILRSPSQ